VGQATGDVVERPAIPPHLARRFQTHIDGAVRLAQAALAARPHDVDAQYQAGGSGGLLALHRGTVEGRTLAAFTEGRRAVALMERIRAGAPDHREAALIPGIYITPRQISGELKMDPRIVERKAGCGDPAQRPFVPSGQRQNDHRNKPLLGIEPEPTVP
jgi:hypothetical protein